MILFGSAARGQLRPDSDLDLAFLSDLALNEYEVFMRAQELAELLGRDVDLIDLNKASTVLKAQIIGKGKVIFNGDNLRRMVFAMKAFKEYALLNEERQCILDRFKERGLGK
ncbi:MAG TPA: nucleotidyltransferase domain-containing protein [Bacillota bacterium]|nr:nucleotidyltransferase domain-containing protein [Bacillota bacterium]